MFFFFEAEILRPVVLYLRPLCSPGDICNVWRYFVVVITCGGGDAINGLCPLEARNMLNIL